MKRSWSIVAALLVVAILFGAVFAPAVAADRKPGEDCEEFDLLAVHKINGEDLGLAKELPVDVYVNGNFAFTFEYKDKVPVKLPAGEYTITVNLAGTDTQVMSLGPVDIPGCAKVQVVAKLIPGEPVPTLVPEIREKQK